jgi:hypothetical protein
MPGRHAYWVIVAGRNTSAFRARRAEDLLPTLKQLQRTEPDAALKWFERSQLWNSPEDAARALQEQRRRARTRGREWRPGGEHRDPRAKYELTRDEKRARFKKKRMRPRPPGSGGQTGSGYRPNRSAKRPKRRD